MKFLRFISLLLALSVVVAILVGCDKSYNDDDDDDGESKKSKQSEKKTTADEDEENVKPANYDCLDSLPDDLSFEGKTFTILGREDNTYGYFAHEITADESSVETVDRAVYKRNSNVEERFGCTIKPLLIPGQWNAKDEFIQYFKQSIGSDSGSFDMIVSQQAYMAQLGLADEYYADINDDEISRYIDLDREYYYQDIKDEITINDTLFFVVGDYSLTYLEYMYVMLFNKQLQKEYNIPDLYSLVKSGDWTLDKLIEYTKMVYEDKSGNGKSNDDVFGLVTDYRDTADALFSQFDCQLTSKDNNGNVTFTIDQNKVASILTKMIGFYDLENVFANKNNSDVITGEPDTDVIFEGNRALFYPERLTKAETFREAGVDFGIVPFPKWDANQAGYYTQSQNGYSVIVIPTDAPDKEFSAAMIEALTAESCRLVVPAYYDVALKVKQARDTESGEMIDIARAGAKINFGYFYTANLKEGSQVFRELMSTKVTAFPSYWAANSRGLNRNLEKIIKQYYDEETA